MMPYEDIPDDLVPLTAHFKHLLSLATPEIVSNDFIINAHGFLS